MLLTSIVKKAIDKNVLCWLATIPEEGDPNIFSKEIFQFYEFDELREKYTDFDFNFPV